MAKEVNKKKKDQSTEDKILEAARKVFHQKGFVATRTRDIAEEAGMNLALLNYYFKNKEKLFQKVMVETLFEFFITLNLVFNDEQSNLDQKLELLADKYIDFMCKEPNVPIFILSEVRNNPETILEKLPIRQMMMSSVFFKQYQERIQVNGLPPFDPIHLLLNLTGMLIFPFVAKPIIQGATGLKDQAYKQLLQERKKLIPIWLKGMLLKP